MMAIALIFFSVFISATGAFAQVKLSSKIDSRLNAKLSDSETAILDGSTKMKILERSGRIVFESVSSFKFRGLQCPKGVEIYPDSNIPEISLSLTGNQKEKIFCEVNGIKFFGLTSFDKNFKPRSIDVGDFSGTNVIDGMQRAINNKNVRFSENPLVQDFLKPSNLQNKKFLILDNDVGNNDTSINFIFLEPVGVLGVKYPKYTQIEITNFGPKIPQASVILLPETDWVKVDEVPCAGEIEISIYDARLKKCKLAQKFQFMNDIHLPKGSIVEFLHDRENPLPRKPSMVGPLPVATTIQGIKFEKEMCVAIREGKAIKEFAPLVHDPEVEYADGGFDCSKNPRTKPSAQ